MANLTFKFTTNWNKAKGRLVLQCAIKGTTTRHYMIVEGQKNPDYSNWDEKKQCFVGLYDGITANNNTLKSLLDTLKLLQSNLDCANGKELFAAYEDSKNVQAKAKSKEKTMTFGKLVEKIWGDEQNKQQGKSTNYQLYQNLYGKLHAKNAASLDGKRIADFPVTEISDTHAAVFAKWILTALNGKSYRNLMTYFVAALNRASGYGLTAHRITYDWRKEKPTSKKAHTMTAAQRLNATANAVATITPDDVTAFAAFDLSTIAPTQQRRKFLVELYRDTVLLMYHTKARPADVIQWHSINNYDEANHRIVYTPHKLRNRIKDNTPETVVTLNADALRIINKYKGMSKGGYLLPLPINETNWGLLDGDVFAKWETRRKNTVQHINGWLERIKNALNLNTPELTMYTFRHSAITHALNNGENVFAVAMTAGTSVAMIEKHYYNRVSK